MTTSVQFANGIINRNNNAIRNNVNRTITQTENGFEVEFSKQLKNGKVISGNTTITNNGDGTATVTGNRVRPNGTVEFEGTLEIKA